MDDVWDNLDLVESTARRMGIDPDMVADIGLQVIQNCARIRDPKQTTNFRAYCRRRLKFRYIRWLSQQDRMPDHISGDAVLSSIGQRESSGLNDSAEEWAELIAGVRARITDDEYALLWTHYVDGVSMELIAQREGVVRGTIWNRIRKIREKIDASV